MGFPRGSKHARRIYLERSESDARLFFWALVTFAVIVIGLLVLAFIR